MKHFTLKELCSSNTAEKNGIDNSPAPEVCENLYCLVGHILDPLRDAIGHPVIINSGYRCRRLNAILHGAKDSAHLYGLAADFTIQGSDYLLDWAWCLLKSPNHPYRRRIDQCIYYKDRHFIHVALPKEGKPRGQYWME